MSFPAKVTGSCYCGATQISARNPQAVVMCHCNDCRRVTGSPASVFVAFREDDLTLVSEALTEVTVNAGAARAFCKSCGSPVTGRYDYLPSTVYIPVGLFDQADQLQPQQHAHFDSKLAWLHLSDALPRNTGSARDNLP